MIKDIENVIRQRLADSITTLSVESFPDDFSDYLDKFSHPQGSVLVTYKGSTFTAPQGMGAIQQKRKVDFSAIIIVRASKAEEVYPYIDAVEQVCMGYKIPGCEKIFLTKSNFLDEIFGKFMYEVNFSLNTTQVEDTELQALPLLKKVTIEDNFGEITEIGEIPPEEPEE